MGYRFLLAQSMCLATEKPSPKPSALRLSPSKINKECVAASSAGLQQSDVQSQGWPFKPHIAKHVLRSNDDSRYNPLFWFEAVDAFAGVLIAGLFQIHIGYVCECA